MRVPYFQTNLDWAIFLKSSQEQNRGIVSVDFHLPVRTASSVVLSIQVGLPASACSSACMIQESVDGLDTSKIEHGLEV